MRDHLAADFAEAAEAVGDGEEAVFVFGGDISGGVPTVAQNFRGFFRFSEVAEHHVGSADEQQAGRADFAAFAGIGINDAHTDAGQGMANASALGADLAESGRAKVAGVDGHYR